MVKKKLLILIKNLDGGTGTFLTQLVRINEFDIHVCALERPKFSKPGRYSFFAKKPYHRDFYGLNPISYLSIINEFFWFRSAIFEQKPDVILSIDTHCNILAACASFGSKSKLIITTHNNLSAVFKRKLISPLRVVVVLLGKVFFRRADCAVCVSKGVANDFNKLFSLKLNPVVIPYGLDAAIVSNRITKQIPSEFRDIFSRKSKKVISVGRFEEQKDFLTLIIAFARLLKEIPDAKLFLIGDGAERKNLEDKVSELKIGPYVHFLGWQENIYPLLKASNLFVLSSRYEGFGYVLLEAMAAGLPVISTKSPFGPEEVMDYGKYGILVPVGKTSPMANAIRKVLLSNKEQRNYSNKSRERIRFYTEEKMLNEYKKLVTKLL